VVLVDPLPLARRGMRALLADHGMACTLSEACDTARALPLMRRLGRGIALVSHRPPRLDAVSLLRILRDEGLDFRIAIIGSGFGRRGVMEALRLDVEGLLPETVTAQALGECVEALTRGSRCLAVELLHEAVGEGSTGAMLPAGLETLTPRQREIAGLVAQGLSNKQIARALGIAEGTVKFQLQRIFLRTGHRNRALLAAAMSGPETADSDSPETGSSETESTEPGSAETGSTGTE